MIAYTLNRDDREDRWLAYKKAMLKAGFKESELFRQSAHHVDDYKNRRHLCDEGAKEFPEFFNFHKDKSWPAYGHIIATWGWLKMLTAVAGMSALEFAVMTPDDYALKRQKTELTRILHELGDVQILQLAYHDCDFIHEHISENWKRLLPKRVQRTERHAWLPVWKDMCMGASNIYVVTPAGAQLILDYFKHTPLNEEHILYGLAHEWAPKGTYSVVENSIKEDGLVPMVKNGWVRSLNLETGGKVSDLIEYYSVSAEDWHKKPKLIKKETH